jgi:hypothetical protein
LEESGTRYCVAQADSVSATGEAPLNLDAGYVQRARERLPKQGAALPWRNLHDYLRDRRLYRRDRVDDGVLQFR